jgi:hypothetical protein
MKKFFLSAVRLLSGLLLGIPVLEAVFRSNTTLLPHGIAAPLPVDPPLPRRRFGRWMGRREIGRPPRPPDGEFPARSSPSPRLRRWQRFG